MLSILVANAKIKYIGVIILIIMRKKKDIHHYPFLTLSEIWLTFRTSFQYRTTHLREKQLLCFSKNNLLVWKNQEVVANKKPQTTPNPREWKKSFFLIVIIHNQHCERQYIYWTWKKGKERPTSISSLLYFLSGVECWYPETWCFYHCKLLFWKYHPNKFTL